MRFCRAAALSAVFSLLGAGAALAAPPVAPQPGVMLSGPIKFPRAQEMSIMTGDGVTATAAMGFDGRCRGGGLGELYSSNVIAKPSVTVRSGRISQRLTGVVRNLGKVQGRSAHFKWRLTGKFTAPSVVVATVSGSAEVRAGGRVISRCKIAKPAEVRLTVRGA